jgi:hypothetical protein
MCCKRCYSLQSCLDQGSSHHADDATTIYHLHDELLALVMLFADLNIRDISNARLSTKLLRGPAAARVRSLLAQDALLPPSAWKAFEVAVKCTAFRTRDDTAFDTASSGT